MLSILKIKGLVTLIKKLIGIITKGDIIKAYNRQRLTRKKMSLDDKKG